MVPTICMKKLIGMQRLIHGMLLLHFKNRRRNLQCD